MKEKEKEKKKKKKKKRSRERKRKFRREVRILYMINYLFEGFEMRQTTENLNILL